MNLISLLIAVLLLTIMSVDTWASEAASDGGGRPLVGVYYYPWYGHSPGPHYFHNALRDKLRPVQRPSLGHYDSRDPQVMATHIEMSHQANVGFWAVSWWGPDSPHEVTLRDHVLAHPRAAEIEFAIHYEATGRFGSFDDPTFDNLVPDFRHLAKHYFDRPNYLRIDGKPVVFIYLTRAFFDDPAGRAAVGELRQVMRDEFNLALYLVGDDFFQDGLEPARARLWDAVTSFDGYGMALREHGSTRRGLAALKQLFDDARAQAHELGVAFIPTASPGYNDRAVREGHAAAPRYFTDETPRRHGAIFESMLDEIAVPGVDPAAANILMINSFNEWYEDTQIEPTHIAPATKVDEAGEDHYTQGFQYEGYGDLYLDILRKATRSEQ